MSRRNSHAEKRRRRAERAARPVPARNGPLSFENDDLVQVHEYGELAELARRGERLACGCDAHETLHGLLDIEPPLPGPGRQVG